ncbi:MULTISPECIES: type II toxin-antitoxin system RelE/ParE family toxin [Chryseobacterium]|uniref:Type II toxin-antitoxin system RelE/ParE family toxin n=1 Tax=Candidatus Chryseobacterium massiliense TaxID=204089 RepID=A0A3D9AN39_9FLAO|nr:MULTISPECIES: type II toxin-antitoxin system RelE/ParE family toxin [Chryseobacterium]REC42731.1 type II toxin-antitoxin system RelE/ParE family toxin [Candidatus Chryseobacterium massiliae]
MIYELIIQEEASLEILEAYIYYENAQKGLGEKFMKQLNKYFVRIQDHPKHFEIKKNYREAFVQIFPYLIIFDIIDNKIIILSVFNTHQNPTKKP